MSSLPTQPSEAGRPARQVLESLWLFAPNRDTQGGSAWWLDGPGPQGAGGCLIDCPAFTEANLALLQGRGEGRILLTSREGHGRVRRFQEALGWPVLVQEQEAYLLPSVQGLDPFGAERELAPGLRLLWTPGPTPGASVLLAEGGALGDGAVLFCGLWDQQQPGGAGSPTATGFSAPIVWVLARAGNQNTPRGNTVLPLLLPKSASKGPKRPVHSPLTGVAAAPRPPNRAPATAPSHGE